MNLRLLFCVLLFLSVTPARAVEEGRSRLGFFQRMLHIFHWPTGAAETTHSSRIRGIALDMQLSPLPLKLSENRLLKVRLTLTNKSKHFVQLEFPTTQRIEILIREKTGKLVTQWSEDQSFANESSYVAINSGERIEYSSAVATRDLAAGVEYLVEGFFPNFDELKARQTIVPER